MVDSISACTSLVAPDKLIEGEFLLVKEHYILSTIRDYVMLQFSQKDKTIAEFKTDLRHFSEYGFWWTFTTCKHASGMIS